MKAYRADITTNPKWIAEQTDRLLAWELLQRYCGRGSSELRYHDLTDKLAMPASFWHGMIRKIRHRHPNAKN
jgi:hypothetical protein